MSSDAVKKLEDLTTLQLMKAVEVLYDDCLIICEDGDPQNEFTDVQIDVVDPVVTIGIAQQMLAEIDAYLETTINPDAASQIRENKSAITTALVSATKTEFSAAFIGKIGAGKTSAICKTSGLQYESDNGEVIDLLKTGAGRTTICEVSIEYAPKYSIKICTLGNNEVQLIIRNFAEFIWRKANNGISDTDEGGSLLSEELTRCIRNMLGLTIQKQKINGLWISTDKALEFSRKCKSLDEVNDLIFGCLSLEERIENELFFPPEESRTWQSWIKESFSKINDGKNKYVSIPSLITICGPFPLKKGDCTWKVIDTRGIDSYIHREDIRVIIDTESVFPVVCSSFVDAPDADCRSFFELGIKLGKKQRLVRDAILLILDKDESDKISDIDDDITSIADRKSIGRGIREDQVAKKIKYDYKIDLDIITFDSHKDQESIIWESLDIRKKAFISSKINDLKRLISATREMLSAEGIHVAAFKLDTDILIKDWRFIADSRAPEWSNFGGDIFNVLSHTHHSTLAACASRKGDFYNLSIYESVNQIARVNAVSFCEPEAVNLAARLSLLKVKYPEFANQIDTIEADCCSHLDRFASYVGEITKNNWLEHVQSLISLWRSMDREWGRGAGYTIRVLNHWKNWSDSFESNSIHSTLLRRIGSSWGRVLAEKQD